MKAGCLIVAPHPDDETIGAGIWMDRQRGRDITVLHLTDGSPRDLANARAAGFHSRRAYAVERRRELHKALRLAGVSGGQFRVFSYVDKETYLNLPELCARLAAMIEELQPSLVLSPAYEGGHPDHDCAAFAVAAARRRVSSPFRHREFPLYHAGPGGAMVSGEFLPCPDAEVEVCSLSDAEQEKKRAMLRSFATQQEILRQFTVLHESFRDAPSYDFTRPPHEGRLLYEHWNLGVSGEQWLLRARQALGIENSPEIAHGHPQ
jgi:N-acetylglucosamine malate deacetylase 2